MQFGTQTLGARSSAVVIGGSMAGLLAARVLSDHFSRVTVIERDHLPSTPEHRAGVPQSHHVHVLLLRGLNILEDFFPGFREEMALRGAMLLDAAQDFSWLTPAGWAPRFPSGKPLLAASRPLIESVVRRRVAAIPNVHFRERAKVAGLSGDGTAKITSVVVDLLAAAPGTVENLPADLVVDASGRASKAVQWLARFGVRRPPETVVNGHLGYASRVYGRRPEAQAEWKATFSQAAPPRNCRTGLAFPLERDRWIVTLAGGASDYPPTDEKGFREFARSLPNPGIYEVIRSSEPLSEIRAYRGTENRFRHWESVKLPAGFAVLGDAVCAFNPVYGQGMSTAAIAAELLDGSLRSGRMRSFQRRLSRALQVPWALATSEDFRYPGVEGPAAGRGTRLMHWYLDRVIQQSVRNTDVRADLLGIFHLMRPPRILFRPGISGRVLRDALLCKPQSKVPAWRQAAAAGR